MRKQNEINQLQLEKYNKFLFELIKEIDANGKKQFTSKMKKTICDRNVVPYSTFNSTLDCGFISEVSQRIYVSNIGHLMPFHTRQLILCQRKRHSISIDKHRKKVKEVKKTNELKKVSSVLLKDASYRPEPKPKKVKKTISLFWGLIKFNY